MSAFYWAIGFTLGVNAIIGMRKLESANDNHPVKWLFLIAVLMASLSITYNVVKGNL